MSHYLNGMKRQQVISLLELDWSYRRIEAETGVRRETVSRYDQIRRANAAKVFAGSATAEGEKAAVERSNAAKVFAGSDANAAEVFAGSARESRRARSTAAPFRSAIEEKLEQGLSAQRIWQDLSEDYGYTASYESVKRYIRCLAPPRRVVGVYHSPPGEEGQVDFFRGAPTLRAETGEWQRPWVFRLTLCCSRHGYEEAAWDQKLETFLRLHERAFQDLAGVPKVLRHDNLKAAVTRACFYDPDSNEIYSAFAKHWNFTSLPTRPRTPQENGKQERSGGYVKDNALKGRRFDSLAAHNEFLQHWNRTVARLRIHGTTRKQVWAHFLETDRPALQALAAEPFPFFDTGMRTVHDDGHVEVMGAFYPAPLALLKEIVRVRWDQHLVRLFHQNRIVTVHRRIGPGQFAPRPGGSPHETTSTQRAFEAGLLARCARVGEALRRWAEDAVQERGVRAYRLIQGVLHLTRTHAREPLLQAATQATIHRLFRYKDVKRLTEQAAARRAPPRLRQEHDSIRAMTDYRLDFLEDLP
ncbi:MAG TPA: IS21 family transposase [Vicinamibacterales bacterium]|nr:IS21 family transposase [Vicinamibacterales bacterium]